MGTIIDKLQWLINRKKEIVNIINSKTDYYNTTGPTKPLNGVYGNTTYGKVDFTDIETQSRAFFPPVHYAELVCIRQYNNGSLNSSHLINYLRVGVGITIARTGTGIYTGSLSRSGDMIGKKYIIHVYGGHRESNYNNSVFASFIYTNYTTTGTTTFKIYTADDDTRNDGAFNIMVWAI